MLLTGRHTGTGSRRSSGGLSLGLAALVLVVFFLVAPQTAVAVPACPELHDQQQPDGRTFRARQVGDERGARFETADGYSITQNADGAWVYAEPGEITAEEKARIDASPALAAGQHPRYAGTGALKPGLKVVGRDRPDGLQKHIRPPTPAAQAKGVNGAAAGPLKGEPPRRGRLLGGPVRAPAVTPASSGVEAAQNGPQLNGPTKTLNVIVLLIAFTDKSFGSGHDPAYYQNALFNLANPNSLASYYNEVSYGQITVTGSVAAIVTSSQTMAYYGADKSTGTDNANGNIYELAREAVTLSNPQVNFAPYDGDGDGTIDYLIVIHAGNDEASPPNDSNDIWSHMWAIQPSQLVDGVHAADYAMVAETNPLGVVAHEFGHDLGLPDLYNTSTGATVVGDWDLMDDGCWNGSPAGATPAELCAWCKINLGWITPTIVGGMLNATIGQVETNPLVYKLTDSTLQSQQEYFLVENRQKTGFDASLPRSGLLIWHVDESQSNNNGTVKMVVPELAGGSLTTAPFSSTWGYPNFNAGTSPNTNTNHGQATTVYASNISVSGSSMTTTLGNTSVSLIVSASTDYTWVYQNTPGTTGNLHQSVLRVSITADPFGNTSYTCTVTQPGSGVVNVTDTTDPLVKNLFGSQRTDGVAGTGTCMLHMVVTGNVGGTASTDISINVRMLGDITGDGFVTGADRALLNRRLHNLDVSPSTDRDFDLDADGYVTDSDRVLLNQILNNLPVP